MVNKKTSQFVEVLNTDSTTFIPLIQGNPLGNRVIKYDNFVDELKVDIQSELVPYSGATQDVNLGNHSIAVDSVKIDTATPLVLSQPGQIGWNAVDGTFDMKLLNNTTLQAGQEMHFYGKALGNISNRDVIQFAGVQGDHFLIKVAVPAEIDEHPEYLIGIATDNITNGNFGYVTCFGKINNVFTTGWTLDSPVLYFDFVNGGMTTVEPQAPTRRIILASIIKLQTGNAENGIIFVRPSQGCKLTDLDDVNGTPLTTNGQIMVWDDERGVFDFTDNINNYEPRNSNIQEHIGATAPHVTLDDKAKWDSPNTLYTPSGLTALAYTDNGMNLHIDGNIYQNGQAYETHAEQVYTKKDTIILREGATAGLASGELSGLTIKNYDGLNDGSIKIDKDGWMRIGDSGNEQKIATIEENSTNDWLMKYSTSTNRLESIDPLTLPISTLASRKFVDQNGGTIYHITRWFTPTAVLQIAANGLSATITSGQFTSAMTGAKLKLTGGINEPIITYVNSNSINLSFAVDSAFFGQSVAVADWGVYSAFPKLATDGYSLYHPNGVNRIRLQNNELLSNVFRQDGGGFYLGYDEARFINTFKFLFSSTSDFNGIKDLGIRRISDGLMEIYNGVTNGVLRDLKLRSLFADKIIPNSDTTGVVIRNAADTADVAYFDSTNKELSFYNNLGTLAFIIRAIKNNTIFGANAGNRTMTGNNNTLIGLDAGKATTTGEINVLIQAGGSITTGSYNTGIGNGALGRITTGISNVGVGLNAGQGATAGTNQTNSYCVFLGANTVPVSNANNQIVIGDSAVSEGANFAVIGNDNIVGTVHKGWQYLNNGTHTGDAVGDRRFKVVSDVEITERCTVANATKGSGTWVQISAIDANGFDASPEYDDILPGMGWVDAAGGAAPDTAAHTIAGIAVNFKAFDGNVTTEAMTNAFEITHAIDIYALNRATAPLLAEIHTHGMAATTGSGVVKIFYDLVYQPVNAAPIAWGTYSNLITINANEQYWHKLGGVELPKPTSGYNIGDQIIVKYYRVPTDVQDTYAGDWLFKQCAMHMPLNSNGSRQRYVK